MERKFKFLIKEMYYYITDNLPRNDAYDNFLGDWKFVQQKLSGGDQQAIIYRKGTELNFLFNKKNRKQVELLTRISVDNEKQLVDALITYFNFQPESKRVVETFNFATLKDFDDFIYLHLLRD